MVGFNMYGDSDCGTVHSDDNSSVTIEEIFAVIGIRLIKVPKEPTFSMFPCPDRPELFCNEFILDKDAVFIVAGMGVVAGEDSYDRLNDGNTVLWWE